MCSSEYGEARFPSQRALPRVRRTVHPGQATLTPEAALSVRRIPSLRMVGDTGLGPVTPTV